jgi:2',3'-cyclic-nucleotide 2'-phosphodiesterase (5'-nucleotidase family)
LATEPGLVPYIQPSIVKQVGSKKIGIIGYLTPETADLAQTGSVRFLDEVEAIQKQVNLLKSQGVDILIAVGHSGYDIDQQIAEKVRKLTGTNADLLDQLGLKVDEFLGRLMRALLTSSEKVLRKCFIALPLSILWPIQ